MICAYINGKIAYPVADSGIKITLQNPFIKDGDDKSMEVVFPLDIPENRDTFGALNRIDTSFNNEDFEEVRLMADNFEVIRGKGTITSITEKEVKIQILSGKTYLRYKASFDKMMSSCPSMTKKMISGLMLQAIFIHTVEKALYWLLLSCSPRSSLT